MSFDTILKTKAGETTDFKPAKKPKKIKLILLSTLLIYISISTFYTTIKIINYFL